MWIVLFSTLLLLNHTNTGGNIDIHNIFGYTISSNRESIGVFSQESWIKSKISM